MQQMLGSVEEKKKRKKLNMKLLKRRERYVFTDKKHPERGIMSTVLGALSVFTIIYAVYLSFLNGGQALDKYAVAVLLCVIYSISGIVLGIMSEMERDIFKLFPNLGIVLNVVALIGIGTLLALAFVF